MLLRRRLVLLVRPDRDVLRPVVRGELATAQSQGGRDERRERDDVSRAPVESVERLAAAPMVEPIATAASTDGRSKGNRTSGSRRRTSGSSAKASARRNGPRTNGAWTPGAKRGFAPEATFTVPSDARTAQPHAVGPCTSTPFARAMPPEAQLLHRSESRGRRPPERRLKLVGGGATAEDMAVDSYHGEHLPTDEEVNASSAASNRSSGKEPSATS